MASTPFREEDVEEPKTKVNKTALGAVTICSIISLILFVDVRSREQRTSIDISIGALISMFLVPGLRRAMASIGDWLFLSTALLSLAAQGFAAGEMIESSEASELLIAFSFTVFASLIGHLIGGPKVLGPEDKENSTLNRTMALISGFMLLFSLPFLFINSDRFDHHSSPAYVAAVLCSCIYSVMMVMIAYLDTSLYRVVFMFSGGEKPLSEIISSLKLVRISLLSCALGCFWFTAGKTQAQCDIAVGACAITSALAIHYAPPSGI